MAICHKVIIMYILTSAYLPQYNIFTSKNIVSLWKAVCLWKMGVDVPQQAITTLLHQSLGCFTVQHKELFHTAQLYLIMMYKTRRSLAAALVNGPINTEIHIRIRCNVRGKGKTSLTLRSFNTRSILSDRNSHTVSMKKPQDACIVAVDNKRRAEALNKKAVRMGVALNFSIYVYIFLTPVSCLPAESASSQLVTYFAMNS